MFVSKERRRETAGQAHAEALNWLQRQLAWESVLRGLRQAAGVLPEQTPVSAGPKAA
ncbi:MAG TPA: hypothetical protein VE991_01840 [Acidimicrobiales bacterium]|nr:hypothetical protein [Acidimicrobiales bacterium]